MPAARAQVAPGSGSHRSPGPAGAGWAVGSGVGSGVAGGSDGAGAGVSLGGAATAEAPGSSEASARTVGSPGPAPSAANDDEATEQQRKGRGDAEQRSDDGAVRTADGGGRRLDGEAGGRARRVDRDRRRCGGRRQCPLQGIGECAAIRVAGRRIRVEGPRDDRIEVGWERRIDGSRMRCRCADPREGDGRGRLARERSRPGEHLVEHEPQAVHVGRGGRRESARLLRAEVMHRAEGRAGDRRLGFGGDPGDPEVGDPRPVRSVEDDVPGLDVAMDDAAGMGHREAAGHVRGDPHGRPRRERRGVADARREVVAVHELHDEERLAAVRAGAEIPDHRGMVQDGSRVGLAPEPQREVRIGDDLGAQQLHGHRPPELRVPRPEDGGHAAPPDQLVEAVAAGEQVSGFGHARTVSGIAASPS